MTDHGAQTAAGIRSVLETFSHTPKAHVQSFGCQLNFCDGEKYKGILQDLGYVLTDTPEDADVILFNACAVRAHAESRVIGRLGALKPIYEKNPRLVVGLCGCMAEEEEVRTLLRKSYPFVKLILGAGAMERLPESLLKVYQGEKRHETLQFAGLPDESLPTVRESGFQASVPVMYGCNNFCTYCIVPYVRGRERSRASAEILKEIEELAASGVSEVMLLGQNVNSYGRGCEGELCFSQLLKEVEKIDGIRRIRFMTSHPKDLSDELIEVMASSEKICDHLHLPVQSGSSRILKLMNRCYSREQYLELVGRLKAAMPDLSLTTDIIVGFPGETEEDIEETISLVEEVKYDNAFTFIYSPRSGTPAAKMPRVMSEEETQKGFDRLLKTVQDCARERVQRFEGRISEALVEGMNEHDASMVTGRLANNLLVHFKGDASMIGSYRRVRLAENKGFYYIGEEV